MSPRVELFSILFILTLIAPSSLAEKRNTPPGGGPPDRSDTGVVSFDVELAADALEVTPHPVTGNPDLAIVSVDLQLPAAVRFEGNAGEPRLPMVQRLVALPRGAEVLEVNIRSSEEIVIDGVPLLEWNQPARPGQSFPQQRPLIPPAVTIIGNEIVFYPGPETFPPSPAYLQTDVWPVHEIEMGAAVGGDAANVVSLNIAPVRWHTDEQRLVFSTKSVVDVTYELPKQQPHFKPTLADVIITADLRDRVVNQNFMPVYDIPFIQKIDAPYLIITDNFEWNEDKTRGAALSGDLVGEFERLAEWKSRKGIRAKVVTVSEIVNGDFGPFAPRAADLQETIRGFLKHARSSWNTYWVLLGGDETIIPPRVVLSNGYANAAHAILRKADEAPEKGRSYFDEGTGKLRIHYEGIDSDAILYSMKDSTPFEFVYWPSTSNPGWGYATDDDYDSLSLSETEYLVVRGASDEATNVHIYLDLDENRIPTDLYYASVDDPLYDGAARDWDANGNGIYGEHAHETTIDGVSFEPDLAVGRVPARDGTTAANWVDRTLAYERYDQNPGLARKLLVAGANWGGSGPPATLLTVGGDLIENHYTLEDLGGGNGKASIHFRSAVGDPWEWILAFSDGSVAFPIRYDRNASSGSTGYFYNTDDTFSERSEFGFSIFGFEFFMPQPTKFVTVFAPRDAIADGMFFFDNLEPDGVIEHKERIVSVLASSAPSITEISRRYQDWYDFPGGPDPSLTLTGSIVESLIGEGQNIVSLAGHGNRGGCCGLNVRDFIAPDSAGVLYVDSCLTGNFTTDSRSLAEYMTVERAEGSSVYLGNTRFSWIGMGNELESAFWEAFRRNDSISAMHHTKASFQSSGLNLWSNYAMTLFGDPELRVWRSEPQELDLNVPDAITPGTRLAVRLTNERGEPVIFTRIAMTGDKVFEVVLTDEQGRASFPPVISPGEVQVVAAPSGYIPAERTVVIAP